MLTARGLSCVSSPRRLTRVSDDDVFEEVRVRHGPWFLCGQLSQPLRLVGMEREYVLSVDDSPFSPVGAVRRNNKQPSVSAPTSHGPPSPRYSMVSSRTPRNLRPQLESSLMWKKKIQIPLVISQK